MVGQQLRVRQRERGSMWFFLIKAIAGAIIGDASAEWFKKTKVGLWFYKKVERLYNWSGKEIQYQDSNSGRKVTQEVSKLDE